MSNLNILIIRFRQKNDPNASWFFLVDPQDQPVIFHTQQAAWDRAAELNEQNPGIEYVPNVLTASMSLAEFDGNKAEVTRLTGLYDAERARADRLADRLATSEQNHQSDLDMISTTLNTEADERGYCSSYDDVMRDLDRRLNGNLTFRDQDYTVTLDVSLSVQITVKADSEDAAINEAHRRHLDRSDVVDAARNGDWSINTDVTEAELA